MHQELQFFYNLLYPLPTLQSLKFSGCQMQTYTNFTFIKDGGNGTNGANFAAEIVVDGYAYGTPHSHFHYPCKLQYIYVGEE